MAVVVVNDHRHVLDGARDTLLGWIRGTLGLTDTKLGCGEGVCGACTVLVDRAPVLSCQTPVAEVDGRTVTTVEGLATGGTLHAAQQALVHERASQCGSCAPPWPYGSPPSSTTARTPTTGPSPSPSTPTCAAAARTRGSSVPPTGRASSGARRPPAARLSDSTVGPATPRISSPGPGGPGTSWPPKRVTTRPSWDPGSSACGRRESWSLGAHGGRVAPRGAVGSGARRQRQGRRRPGQPDRLPPPRRR